MKALTSLLVLSILILVSLADESEDRENEAKWVQFKLSNGKAYHHTEESLRKTRFLQSDRKIKEHNSKSKTYKMAHNKFSDSSVEEKLTYLGAVLPSSEDTRSDEHFYASLSESDMRQISSKLDYRPHKCLGPVKNQGRCGSCWAFAAMTPLEFSTCNKTGTYVSLSEQQLVDCDPNDGGCNGGFYSRAWSYLMSNSKGANPTSTYPYTAVGSTCKFKSSNVVARVSSYGMVPPRNVNAIKAALNKYGPLAVALQVIPSFYRYSSGVYEDSSCPTDGTVNHAVTLIGYDANYWIIRNSWGANWGDKGNILVKMGVNMCSIESWVFYVVAG